MSDEQKKTLSRVELIGVSLYNDATPLYGKEIHESSDKAQIAYLIDVNRINQDKAEKEIKALRAEVAQLRDFNKNLVAQQNETRDAVLRVFGLELTKHTVGRW